MTLEHVERHRDKQLTIQCYEFQFSSVQRKSTVVFMLRLKQQQQKLLMWESYVSPIIRDWAPVDELLSQTKHIGNETGRFSISFL